MATIIEKKLKNESQSPLNSFCSFNDIPNATFPSINPSDKDITIEATQYTMSHVLRHNKPGSLLRNSIATPRKINPTRKSAAAYEPFYREYDKLYPALKERFREIASLGQ